GRRPRSPLHLVITAAEDVTSHLLFERLGDRALRLNWEAWGDYSLRISPEGFVLADGYGRVVNDRTLGNVLWRKPLASVAREPGEQWYGFVEFRACVEAILAQ